MTNTLYIPLPERTVLNISGKDSSTFLQGLITNNITKVTEHQAIYALMLTPQGKYLYDFFILHHRSPADSISEGFLIDCSAACKDTIIKKLSMYKLRSAVDIRDSSEQYEVVALISAEKQPAAPALSYTDPRSPALGARAFMPRNDRYQALESAGFTRGTAEAYATLRLQHTIPSGDDDLESGESFPLDYGMNHINAIDYTKGCYVGQEVTARVHHRGTLRKQPYTIESTDGTALPAPGTPILSMENKPLGQLRSSCGPLGLGLLHNEDVAKANFRAHYISADEKEVRKSLIIRHV